jgi:peptide methionine sulfoxide reductase MsrA
VENLDLLTKQSSLNINVFALIVRKLSKGGNTLKTWIMSEEERQQYIKKNPPKPTNKRVADYKWRGQAAADASKKERDKKRQQ